MSKVYSEYDKGFYLSIGTADNVWILKLTVQPKLRSVLAEEIELPESIETLFG